MQIAITGSSGLIGRALTQHLTGAGHEIVHLVRRINEATDATRCHWDPERGVQQLDKLEGVRVVVHLAGRSIGDKRWTKPEKRLIVDSRLRATEQLCASLKTLPRPLDLFVCASAVGIYGECGDQPVTEQRQPVPSPQAAAQMTAELTDRLVGLRDVEFLRQVGQQWESAAVGITEVGTRVAFTRFGIVLSPSGGALAKMLPLFRWGLGGNLGSGQQYWSWIDLRDVVRAIAWIIQRHSTGNQPNVPESSYAYNLVAPQPVTNAQFTQDLAQAVGRTRFLPVPRLALRGLVGEFADAALLTSCRAVPAQLLSEGFQFDYPELPPALKRVGSGS